MKKSLKNITLIRPLGRGGMGGIDRVVENELITIDDDAIIISETVTRGNYNIWLSPIFLLNAIFMTIPMVQTACLYDKY